MKKRKSKYKYKIAIAYSYYNAKKETPRALDPWYPHVDYIIAIDGRYKTPMTPKMHKRNLPEYSNDNTDGLLMQRYGDKLIHEQMFDTQIAKRQRIFDIAGELKCDLVIVWDSDDIIHPDYQDWDLFFTQLNAVMKYWKEPIFQMWAWLPDESLWPKQHNATPDNIWKTYSRIHRNPGEQRYAQTHWTWANKHTTDDQINQWRWKHESADINENPYFLKTGPTIDGIRITTDRLLRTVDALEYGDDWAYQNMHWETYHYNLEAYLKYRGVELPIDRLRRKFPDLQYYFAGDNQIGMLVAYHLDKDGNYIIVHEDGSEYTLEEHQKYMAEQKRLNDEQRLAEQKAIQERLLIKQ